MALKSRGTIPQPRSIADANQAIALLATMHHWRCTVGNRYHRRTYEVTITHAGRRVRAGRQNFVEAVIAAFDKLRDIGQQKAFSLADSNREKAATGMYVEKESAASVLYMRMAT